MRCTSCGEELPAFASAAGGVCSRCRETERARSFATRLATWSERHRSMLSNVVLSAPSWGAAIALGLAVTLGGEAGYRLGALALGGIILSWITSPTAVLLCRRLPELRRSLLAWAISLPAFVFSVYMLIEIPRHWVIGF